MYEVSVALQYLIPRRRYLSVSIISTISIFVIATVVWLTIVFFSATEGLERRWTEKLINITAPVRIIPKDTYYRSYDYLIDSMSEHSSYAVKTLREKLDADAADPYNPEHDPELPLDFPKKGDKNLVKEAFNAAQNLKAVQDVEVSVFETAFATTTIRLIRQDTSAQQGEFTTRVLTQPSYLVNFELELQNLQKKSMLLPSQLSDSEIQRLLSDNGVVLPKSFRDSGVHVGDHGTFGYYAPQATSLQEQQIAFTVAGFYDPGIIPIGGKLILVNPKTVSLIQSASQTEDGLMPTGLNVSFQNYGKAVAVQKEIENNLQKAGIASYFTVETYDQYEFTKDIFQQLKSERNLFSLISLIIIVVACSNIISMLIILVRDKHKEVAILRALGATKRSIGFIFGLSGFLMGATGSVIGASAAYVTVKNLNALLSFLGKLQGFDVLNTNFYGEMMPTDVSLYAFLLVMISTAVISTLAGIIAALQASRQNTSDALREG
ncbi:MAG: transporter permease [Chlamydiia bacterium]|nr:transporter permease [Chlamydiia bacterium]